MEERSLFKINIEKDKAYIDGEAISLKLAAKICAQGNIYSIAGKKVDMEEFIKLIDKFKK